MNSTLIWATLAILSTSFLVCALLVVTQRWHGRLSLDNHLNGAQKLHVVPVPRIGGVGLLLGLMIGIAVGYQLRGETYRTVILLMIASIPVFTAGMVEDLTKRVSVRTRLIASFLSAALAIVLVGAHLTRLDTPLLDNVMLYWLTAAGASSARLYWESFASSLSPDPVTVPSGCWIEYGGRSW